MSISLKKLIPAMTIALAIGIAPAAAYAGEGTSAASAEGASGAAALTVQADDSASALVAQASTKAQKKANRAYYKKLKGYLAKYGNPKRVKDSSSKTQAVTGVAFAKLINIDRAGTSELVVAYYNKAKENKSRTWNAMPDALAYYVEVWGYVKGKAKVLIKSKSDYSNGGFAFARLFNGTSKAGLHKWLVPSSSYTTKGTNVTSTYRLRTLAKGKVKTPMKAVTKNMYTVNAATYVNGKRAYGNATGNWLDSKLVKYDVVTAQLMKSDASSNVAYPGDGVRKSIYYTPAKLVKITKSTIATLKKA